MDLTLFWLPSPVEETGVRPAIAEAVLAGSDGLATCVVVFRPLCAFNPNSIGVITVLFYYLIISSPFIVFIYNCDFFRENKLKLVYM